MELKKNYLVAALLAAALVGCGGDDDDDNDDNTGVVTPPPVVEPEPTLPSFVSCTGDVCTLSGTIDEDYELTADKKWLLDGFVQVGAGNAKAMTAAEVQAIKDSGVTLSIQPGTDIRGLDDGVLLVTRGSKLMAEGTAAQPITFSSDLDDNYDGLGEWGGVIIQGFAPQYGAGNTGACFDGNADGICNVQGEGGDGVGFYAGNNKADNSGVIKYVRIAEAGKVAGPNNEVNGLTLQGVGHGTTVEYVQVHNNLDDAVEWFGGTVNAKYLVLTGNDDDDIDFDTGYQGNIQYAIVRKDAVKAGPSGSNDPRGIEANSSDEDYVPQTEGALANITIVGSAVSDGQPGMRLRGSLTTRIYNTAVLNFVDCVRIDDSDHDQDEATDKIPSDVTLTNVIGACTDGFYAKRDADTVNGTVGANTVDLDAAAALVGAPAGTVNAWQPVDNGSGFAFDNTDYIGAVAPGTAESAAWWAGWTIPGSLEGIETQGE
ncbi:hypothetical protein CHH28_11000 [Bacterioplanes sanyensis]|uniref:Uncharacterized protein n=1 Tax=Bacterioplanes sanyensis TaxID=1249553 RepID=A0A222FRR3_9GAMM|nr:hypothetical protein [Bacterioplanes sanyensis]ASP40903.1 hypothetical protein CHH28_11000 [Bacterioplanes sanyensis]